MNAIIPTGFAISLCFVLASQANAQSGLADSMCMAYMPVVEQAVSLRQQEIPIDIALDTADSAFDVNENLWLWLDDAITLAYQDPDLVKSAIADGRLLENCIQSVRGF
jgi:hypothetical protein